MKLVLLSCLMLALACGGSSPPSDPTCSAVFGQDCGPTHSVTMVYTLDAGPGVAVCDVQLCQVTKSMSEAQLYYAVVPLYGNTPSTGRNGCLITATSTNTETIDCTERDVAFGLDAGCSYIPPNPNTDEPARCQCAATPVGVSDFACDWQPPLLAP